MRNEGRKTDHQTRGTDRRDERSGWCNGRRTRDGKTACLQSSRSTCVSDGTFSPFRSIVLPNPSISFDIQCVAMVLWSAWCSSPADTHKGVGREGLQRGSSLIVVPTPVLQLDWKQNLVSLCVLLQLLMRRPQTMRDRKKTGKSNVEEEEKGCWWLDRSMGQAGLIGCRGEEGGEEDVSRLVDPLVAGSGTGTGTNDRPALQPKLSRLSIREEGGGQGAGMGQEGKRCCISWHLFPASDQ